jgi:iron(III) transport system ATP-binding protein
MALSDRIVVLGGGVIQHVGTPREIYTQPANRFVADFVGFENLLKAEVKSRASDHFVVMLDPAGPVFKVASATKQPEGSTVEIAVRASAFRLAHEPNGGTNVFDATVDGQTYLGEETEYQLRAGGTNLIVRLLDSEIRAIYGTRSPSNGDVIRLRVNPEELIEISP